MIALGRKFNVGKKLGCLVNMFRSSQDRLEVLEQRIRVGKLFERLLDSREYREGLISIFQARREKAFTNLRRGVTGTALDELDGIEADIKQAIRIGKEAQNKLTKLKGDGDGRGNQRSSSNN